MIPILGSALLGILFAVFLVLKIKKKVGLTKTSEILSMIGWLGVFFALVFGFLGLIAAAILTILLPDQSYQTLNRVQLYGTRSSVVSSGELFLGIGTVDG